LNYENLGNKLVRNFEDDIRNVIIRVKDRRMEKRSHCNAGTFGYGTPENSDTVFDFDTQGIDMYIDGDWVRTEEQL
jgi:dipeptidase D